MTVFGGVQPLKNAWGIFYTVNIPQNVGIPQNVVFFYETLNKSFLFLNIRTKFTCIVTCVVFLTY